MQAQEIWGGSSNIKFDANYTKGSSMTVETGATYILVALCNNSTQIGTITGADVVVPFIHIVNGAAGGTSFSIFAGVVKATSTSVTISNIRAGSANAYTYCKVE